MASGSLLLVVILQFLSQVIEGYSYQGRLAFDAYSVGNPEQIRVTHVSPVPAFLKSTASSDDVYQYRPCTISWTSELRPSLNTTKYFESNQAVNGGNASAYFSQVQIINENEPNVIFTGYANIYAENRCGTLRLISSVYVDLCGRRLKQTNFAFNFHYRVRNAQQRSADPILSPINSWTDIISARLPSDDIPTNVAMVADMALTGHHMRPDQGPSSIESIMKANVQAVLHVGDVAYDIDDDCGENGDAFMRGIEPISSKVPWIFVVGDHEGGRKSLHYKDLGGHCGGDYEGLFMRIGMGKGGAGGGFGGGQHILSRASRSGSLFFFSFDIGLIHFVAINSDAWIHACNYWMLESMTAWLRSDLARVERKVTPWVILLSHRSLYCVKNEDTECNQESGALRYGVPAELLAKGLDVADFAPRAIVGNEENQYGLEPIINEFNVDIVFSGHTHHYERSYPSENGAPTSKSYINPSSPVYITGGLSGVTEDKFELPPEDFTAFRDEQYRTSWGNLTAYNDSVLEWKQVIARDDSELDSFIIDRHQKSGSIWQAFSSMFALHDEI